MKKNNDLYMTPLWFNPNKIPQLPLYHKWCEKGICVIYDLFNNDNTFKTKDNLVEQLGQINIFNYLFISNCNINRVACQ